MKKPWVSIRNKNYSEELSHSYKGANVKRLAPQHTYYKKIMEKAKKCFICKQEKKLELHHKDGNHKNNSLSNLMPICRSCHNTIQPRTDYDSLEFKEKQRISHSGKKHWNWKGGISLTYKNRIKQNKMKE